MELVKSWEAIEKNLMTLEDYRDSNLDDEAKFYLNRIKRGRCFVIYEHNGQLIFGPSRFVGYINNSMNIHLANQDKDGRKTNPAISKVLGGSPKEDEDLEEAYQKYCESLGISPDRIKRKYWYKKG